MKPRPLPLPPTDEDSDIWFHHVWGDDWRNVRLYNHSQQSDRRDADLMLYAQRNGKLGYVVMSTDREAVNSIVWVRAPSAYDVRKYTE